MNVSSKSEHGNAFEEDNQGNSALLYIDPIEHLKYLWRYKLQIASIVVLSIIIAMYFLASQVPIYRSTSTLLIEPREANVIQIDEVYERSSGGYLLGDYLRTQHEVLRSRELAMKVAKAVNLHEHEEYSSLLTNDKPTTEAGGGDTSRFAALLKHIRSILEDYGRPWEMNEVKQNKTVRSDLEKVTSALQQRIQVDPVINSFLVKLKVESSDPELSARLANNLAEAYIRSELDSRLGITEHASGWLTQRLAVLRKELESSEKKLQEFYESQKLVNIGGARKILADDLADNSQRLRDARKRKTELKNVYQKIIQSRGDINQLQEIAVIQQEPLVQSTKRSFLESKEQVEELRSRYGPKHPKMIAASARLAQASTAYERQLGLAADGIKSQYEISANTEISLAKIVDESKSEMQKLDRRQHELESLQREVETNRDLFNTFLTRYKETDISSNLDIGSARVVDRAVIPTRPYKPRKKLWVATAALVGLILGSILALVRGILDDRILRPSDLENVAGVPVLGVLPEVNKAKGDAAKVARIEIDDPKSAFAEGIRSIRTSVLLADSTSKKQKLLVTSSVPEEGKTSIAVNLAITFSQTEKVLLIDCDLRKPSIAKYLRLKDADIGLISVLSGERSLQSVLKKPDGIDMDVLPCGKPPASPSELLMTQRFTDLLAAVEQHYDRIIIDSPPCTLVSDTLLLSSHCDSVIFLAKADETHAKVVRGAIRQLRMANAPILGAVLNQADMRKGAYGDGYYYYQQGYYGQST